MALTVNLRGPDKPAKKWKADRDLYLNADKTKVVEDGKPGAAWLLTRKGQEVNGALVAQYKLSNKPKRKHSKPKAEGEGKDKSTAKGGDKAGKKGSDK
jgi:hypothetical protein